MICFFPRCSREIGGRRTRLWQRDTIIGIFGAVTEDWVWRFGIPEQHKNKILLTGKQHVKKHSSESTHKSKKKNLIKKKKETVGVINICCW